MQKFIYDNSSQDFWQRFPVGFQFPKQTGSPTVSSCTESLREQTLSLTLTSRISEQTKTRRYVTHGRKTEQDNEDGSQLH